LISNVCHIKDTTLGSTLVSHILVRKEYHQMKGVSFSLSLENKLID